ncbi:hypothetical protein F5B22DRAFT_62114 [Xylaria bambusicola]|uniref:uncharacterized protein n=1 Tax=Xylaria bambusicola TaxID=326684 RepID=UPI0020086111|nr:uncharacterized protein F5B22DRAFT_62114 [Xylaria bambusicola]KAI0518431.1 hypothetical protein F5B22DRAFT_62114 [Xylaria bambusicola]
MFDNFSMRHVPALLAATPMFLGGLFHGLMKPKEALLTYGMSERTANSREGQIVYYGHTMRTSTLGLLVLVFYLRGDLAAVDTTMTIMGSYCGLADVFLLWRYGDRSKAPVRLLNVSLIAAWGFAGMTASSEK